MTGGKSGSRSFEYRPRQGIDREGRVNESIICYHGYRTAWSHFLQSAHYNQSVYCNNPFLFWVNKKWIDIDFGYLRMRSGEPAEPRSNLCNRAKIERGRAAEPSQ